MYHTDMICINNILLMMLSDPDLGINSTLTGIKMEEETISKMHTYPC